MYVDVDIEEEILARHQEGWKNSAIAAKLNKDELPARDGGKWTAGKVFTIIECPRYQQAEEIFSLLSEERPKTFKQIQADSSLTEWRLRRYLKLLAKAGKVEIIPSFSNGKGSTGLRYLKA